MDMKKISTQLMYSTLIIRCKKKDGQYYTGTGFFFQINLSGGRNLHTVVTNKHVVVDSIETTGILQEGEFGEDGDKHPKNHGFLVSLPPWGEQWVKHPSSDVDLCLTFVDSRQDAVKKGFFVTISDELILSDEQLSRFQAVEDVLMVGYPLGRFDNAHHLPIFRKGITASHPSIDFNGKPEGLCDISVYPGSSGSPILIVNESVFVEDGKIRFGSRAVLIGILHQYYSVDVLDDDVPQDVPIKVSEMRGRQLPANMALYVKAKELLRMKEAILAEHPEIR